MDDLSLKEKVGRRLDTARNYERASSRLASSLDDFGPASTVLDALAFEIKLKAIAMMVGTNASFGHDCAEGWRGLPQSIRVSLLDFATERFGTHVDYSDMDKVLSDTSRAFTHYRYDYEPNEGRTKQEISEKSNDWDDPDFQFHPFEVKGLLEAIDAELNDWLKAAT